MTSMTDEPAPAPEAPQPALDEAAAERDRLRDQLLRASADLQNLRRRMEKDVEERAQRKAEGLLRALLDAVDAIDRAREAAPPALRDGLRLISEALLAAAAREGVRPIASVGAPFDPKLHEAISVVPKGDAPAGQVVAEQRRGYLWSERVLRPAQVLVAGAPDDDAPPDPS
jgi:molecular chaperone GrpE